MHTQAVPVQNGVGGVSLGKGGENIFGILGADLDSIGNNKGRLLLGYAEDVLPPEADFGLRKEDGGIEAAGHSGQIHAS